MVTQAPPRTQAQHPQAWGIVFHLSRADLRHEWLLTMCSLLAVAAVLSPLLLIFGLKYGTIETLRTRLVQDPRNREIRPMTSYAFPRHWFASLQQRPDIAFLIPMTRQIAATVTASVVSRADQIKLNLIPTGPHDPLLLENGAAIPASGECVLTHVAAAQLQAQVGQTLRVTARRITEGRYETGPLTLQVVGILPIRASTLASLYVRFAVLEAVEHFKDGQAVPAFDWPGTRPTAPPRYSGLVVILPQPLARSEMLRLQAQTGFSRLQALTPEALRTRTQWHIAADVAIYLLSNEKTPVGAASIEAVRHRLRGQGALLLPWILPLPVQLLAHPGNDSTSLHLYVLPEDPRQLAELHFAPMPAWQPGAGPRQVMLPTSLAQDAGEVSVRLIHDTTTLTFPVTPTASHPFEAGVAFVPSRLGGVLNGVRQRQLRYDAATAEFLIARRGYAGFRLYAKTIDDVAHLQRYFAAQALQVHTEAQRIQDVTELDRSLTWLFWGIAVVSIAGGATALLANLYAAVERKMRDLGVLRLLGISRRTLLRYPIYQGLMVSAGGGAASLLFFVGMAMTINHWFRDHLGPGESVCRLSIAQATMALGLTLLIALLASLCAAWRITRIDPAEAIRNE